MTETNIDQAGGVPAVGVVEEEVAGQLVQRARAEGLTLTGPDGLLGRLPKMVLETALDAEMTEHLGDEPHERAGVSNARHGTRAKTVRTEVGPVEIDVPRDRDSSFEPKIVAKRQRRLTGVDDMVISLVATGLTTGEGHAHLAEVYGTEVSMQTISTIIDWVLEEMAEWANRPLDAVYPVIFIDGVNVQIRDGQVANRPVYAVLAVTVDGERDILRWWAGDGGGGAKYWLRALTEIKNRGVGDVLIVVCDGLKGLPDASGEGWGPALSPRPASSTCCETASARPAGRTEPRSPRRTSSRSTPPRPRPPRWVDSPTSPQPGRPATRRSSGWGRMPGRSSSRSSRSTPRSAP